MSKEEDDINLAFESILMAENSRYNEGLIDGQQISQESNHQTGLKLGINKGCELAQEVGFYQGFVESLLKWMDEEKRNELSKTGAGKRAVTVVGTLDRLLKGFYDEESTIDMADESLTDDLEKIRSKFKQAMSLLKLDVSFGLSNPSSF